MTPETFVAAFNQFGSVKAVHREMGVSYRQARKAYLKAVKQHLIPPQPVGRKSREENKLVIVTPKPTVVQFPKENRLRRYILTCAQNDTPVSPQTWDNIQAMAKHYDAEIHVARFTYMKSGWGAEGDKAAFTRKEDTLYGGNELTWDPIITPYLSDERIELAPDLVWCGEMNILPTAVNPLSGLTVYTGRKSTLFPHVKIAMESVASFGHGAKFVYTTGAVTLPNYIKRKAGLKAEFHHCQGGMLVEVRPDGTWFARHLNADHDGTIYDLDVRAQDGRTTTGHRLAAITWGDIHRSVIDPLVLRGAWGEGGMLDYLKPYKQFVHDVVDFEHRNPHTIKHNKYHDAYRVFLSGPTSVEAEMQQVANFLAVESYRDWCTTISVDSNHHRMFLDWMHMGDYRRDPKNARYFLEAQKWCYDTMHNDPTATLNLFKWAIEREVGKPANLVILDQDESYIICPDAGSGIECGMHGHQGPNGARGNPRSLSRMGYKANGGHVHSTSIVDGFYTAGTCSRLKLAYTNGPSSWSHSHIGTYQNGKRTIITMRDGEFKA